jgi:DNA-binding MarR family transcriptional regulator
MHIRLNEGLADSQFVRVSGAGRPPSILMQVKAERPASTYGHCVPRTSSLQHRRSVSRFAEEAGEPASGYAETLDDGCVRTNYTGELFIWTIERTMSGTSQIYESQLTTLAGELRAVIAKLNRRLKKQAHVGDFTNAQKSVILRLERDGPATASMLARAEGVRPQSMGITISALEMAGVVSGKPDPEDGRQTFLSLTPSFLKIVKSGRAAREDWLFRALEARFAPREHAHLVAAVKLLSRLADL